MERTKFSGGTNPNNNSEPEEETTGYYYDEPNEPIVISKTIMDLVLKEDHPLELLGTYLFYYYTGKWQKTNRPRATNTYVANGLKIGAVKLKGIKKKLKELGLITAIARRGENGKIRGHYVKVNFLWSQD